MLRQSSYYAMLLLLILYIPASHARFLHYYADALCRHEAALPLDVATMFDARPLISRIRHIIRLSSDTPLLIAFAI